MDETPAQTPEPEFSKDIDKTGPGTHCPACHQPANRYAKQHCPKTNTYCRWLICKCGTTWDTRTGHSHAPINGTK